MKRIADFEEEQVSTIRKWRMEQAKMANSAQIHAICKNGSLAELQNLLNAPSVYDANMLQRGRMQETPMYTCMREGNKDAMILLYLYGGFISYKDIQDDPLTYALDLTFKVKPFEKLKVIELIDKWVKTVSLELQPFLISSLVACINAYIYTPHAIFQ